MAVAAAFGPTTIRRVGFGPVTGDQRIPAGMWFRQDTATGDATGGTVTVTQTWPDDFIYSCEEAYTFVSAALTIPEFEMQWTPSLPLLETGFRAFFPIGGRVNVVTGISNIMTNRQMNLPMSFLINNVGSALMTTIFHENVNTEFYRVSLWGYYWQLDAVRRPGGPQRPMGR